MSDGLNAKQERFVEEYLATLDAKGAATEAGYAERSAKITGHRLLQNPAVAAAIQQAKAARSERTQVTADLVIEQLWEIAKDAERNDGARVSALTVLARHTGVIADGATLNVGGDHRRIHVHLDGGPDAGR